MSVVGNDLTDTISYLYLGGTEKVYLSNKLANFLSLPTLKQLRQAGGRDEERGVSIPE
jgi:hypothetical protein